MEAFAKFEHEGWQRVAGKYDSVWASSTRQFIPPLLDAAEVAGNSSVLDVGCGPGYVAAAAAERGATPRGLDFSKEMVTIAQKRFPHIEFCEGDAQNLPFTDATFDRVLKASGKFGFTVWAPPEENPYAKMIDDAIQAHADLEINLPIGPPHYLFSGREEFRRVLERVGFNGASLIFKLHTIRWNVPSACYPFDAERNAGVRTAGLLARQTSEKLRAIQLAIEESVRRYAEGDSFSIPKAAYVVAVSKK
jgi:SAM-dependent methyltransferase